MYRVLLVEDDLDSAKLIAEYAAKWELEVRYVTSFRDVMRDFAEYEPHIVLLDITLPFSRAITGAAKYGMSRKLRSYSSRRRRTT